MEGLAFGVGILVAVLGPLLLVPVIYLLYRYGLLGLLQPHWPEADTGSLKVVALVLSAVVVVGVVGLSYLPGRLEFNRLCAEHGSPTVSERIRADGFYRTQLFPYEAHAYLRDVGFDYIEAPDPYRPDTDLRYTLAENGELAQEEVTELRSRHGVRQEVVQSRLGTARTEKVIYELDTGNELARASSLIYDGGPLSLFLGVYGTTSCPNVRTREGSAAFQTFYELEKRVLGGG